MAKKTSTNQQGKRNGAPGKSGKSMQSRPLGPSATSGNQYTVNRSRGPQMKPTKNGRGLIVSNTEVLEEVVLQDTALYTQNIPLNPCAALQWLAFVARNYQKYRFLKLEATFVSRLAVTRDGSVAMGMFYDYESSQDWKVNSTQHIRDLSNCLEFTESPIYGGNQIERNTSGNWVGVAARCSADDRRYTWFTCDLDPGSTASEQISRFNLCTQNFLGVHVAAPGLAAGSNVGRVFLKYTIELSECAKHLGTNALLRSILPSDDPHPWNPNKPFPDSGEVATPAVSDAPPVKEEVVGSG